MRWFSMLVCVVTCWIGCEESAPPDRTPGSGGDAGPSQDAGARDGAAGDAAVDAVTGDGGDDHLGPVIAAVAPKAGELVAGVVTLVMTVTDEGGSGIDTLSVVVTVGDGPGVPMTPGAENRWSARYDTVPLKGLVFPLVVVRAKDKAGNASRLGYEIALDNEAPFSSLDPPRVRESRRDTSGSLLCSRSFDPVGDDAPSDGEAVAQLIELRARIEDRTNAGTSTSDVAFIEAGIDEGSVQLYVLDDTGRPLIVDSDGDHECDAINPELVPTTVPSAPNEAAVVDLVAIPGSGQSYFTSQLGDDGFNGLNRDLEKCRAPAEVGTLPKDVCNIVKTTRIPLTSDDKAKMIFTIPPVEELACMGLSFDAVARNIHDGWACAAVLAADNLGNQRVSPVLRICIDRDEDGAEGCLRWRQIAPPEIRPDCTGTYDSGTVTSTPCTVTKTFRPREAAGDYELVRLD